MSLEAASPEISATVTASAGSGKTWLLVSRMARLLLHGAEPGSILALTFTRKAAGEMQARLTERLRDMAQADEQALVTLLKELGEEPTAEIISKARQLYEQCLFHDFPVRTMTFHSFCQDVLSRFPIEANLPPDFELVENTELLIEQSIQQLYSEATLSPDGELADNLGILLEHCQSIHSTQTALKSFINHRSDWWAYTETEQQPVDFAINHLAAILGIADISDPATRLFSRSFPQKLEQFRNYHLQVATDKEMVHAETIQLALENDNKEQAYYSLLTVFLTQALEPKKRKVTKKSIGLIGEAAADEYVTLHFEIAEQLLEINDLFARRSTHERNVAWFKAGNRLLDIFQQLKSQLHNLDFTDLEWRTYQLLRHSDNAEWVQFKLDQRINHLLIDEFQDTNPTQWYLLKPLLEELSSGDPERQRSIFIVGDEKQSIYGFRRANPELQAYVSNWLEQQIGAMQWPLNKSWRSSPAVIDLVNAVFKPTAGDLLESFPEHGTHKTDLPGQIVLKSIFPAPDKADLPEPVFFRNPLHEARTDAKNLQYINEAEWIAATIKQIVSDGLLITKGEQQLPARYDDIYILLKNRTHVGQIEQTLRKHQIPFISANRYTLLNCLEISDLEMLLEILVTPHNDIALAQVLKSPIFNATDQDLLQLATVSEHRRWFKRLELLAATKDAQHPIARAFHFLTKWREKADKIPVHDLLDIIFYDSNLLNRYQAACADSAKAQVKANLLGFLDLALEVNSGRYPSISHFLNKLRSLKKLDTEAPDEASANSGMARVNIMTIHAAKGLEAPIVFMADTASVSAPKLAHKTMVNWPTTSNKPDAFHLMGVKTGWDTVSKKYVDKAAGFQNRENLNLLYVALTRAKQFLFISASAPNRTIKSDNPSWYQLIEQGMLQLTQSDSIEEQLCYQSGEINTSTADDSIEQSTIADIIVPAELSQIIFEKEISETVNPSQADSDEKPAVSTVTDEDGMTRGTITHRALELLTASNSCTDRQVLLQLKIESGDILSGSEYLACLNEAKAVIAHTEFTHLFNCEYFDKAYNELPIHYHAGNKEIHGVIDRVVIKDNTLYLIDYKSHQNITIEGIPTLADEYKKQLEFYKQGLQKVWPDHTIRPMLLFTHCRELYEFHHS
ncbi:MAG: UvrD-helicase domain-containing protein [Gammaproteobacteria bacterium]|nr:UvrD-helicase domain-containing protein [Gammaproteobacteria bacterium]